MSEIGRHILYVDDDVGLARLFEKACRRRGFTLTHAVNVDEGLAALASKPADVVVLDHDLNSGIGLDFLAQVQGPGYPPVVYVTGTTETAVAVAALKAGAADYVIKTIADDFFELLFSAIEQALERARLRLERERADGEMRAAKERAELLLREVNHRVANSLSLVAAMIKMQTSVLIDPAAISALSDTQARISAIAGVHRRLYTSTEIGAIPLHEYLRGMTEELDSSLRATSATQVRFTADPCWTTPDAAVSVGVIVTELVTNVFKYAYPGEQSGEARVSLRQGEDGTATLVVEDDGIGWDTGKVALGTGLGTRIIRAMAANLGSSVIFEGNDPGTRAILSFPAMKAPADL